MRNAWVLSGLLTGVLTAAAGEVSFTAKPTVAGPEFPLAWPAGAGMSDQHIYVIDTYNKRVLRADKTWAAEETCVARRP